MSESATPTPLQAGFASWPVRLACIVFAGAALLAIYGPLLCNRVALAYNDGSGWRFPALSTLFDAGSYPKIYDLAFNLMIPLLPAFVAGWWALRRWSAAARALLCVGVLLVAMGVANLPILPTAHGWQAAWRRRPAEAGTVERVIAARQTDVAVRALLPPVPHRWDDTFPGATLLAPLALNAATGERFWLGTDPAGRDVLAQMVTGARISLTVGIFATGLSMLIGLILGALSGYLGGWVDLLIQRLVEIMMTFPTFILILVVVAVFGRDIVIIMTVIGLTGWAGTARLVRGEYLTQSVREYVAAAESLGLSRMRIMFRHILPNAATPLLISAVFSIAGAIGTESGLAFIGLGDITVASWGVLMDQGRQNIEYLHLILVPGLAIFVLVTCLNAIGQAVRTALDPREAG